MKRKLLNVMIYGAMVLTACAVNRSIPGSGEKAAASTVSEAGESALESGAGEEITAGEETVTGEKIEAAVSNAIFHKNSDAYMPGECMAEGHHLLETEENGEQVTVYALTMFGYYGFEDGNFVKVSGSGAIPVVITFKKHPDGSFGLLDYQNAMDGGMYLESIKDLFPERLQEQCIQVSETVMENLREQERVYAKAYLKDIGRTAQIGDSGDYDRKIFTDLGVPVGVSNKIAERKELGAYPFWLGNLERVEDGIRYVYEMAYLMDKEEIRYTKYVYDTEEIVEQHVYDALTGNQKTD